MEILTNYLADISHPVFIVQSKSRKILFANKSAEKNLPDNISETQFEDVVQKVKIPVSEKQYAHFGADWYNLNQSDFSSQYPDHQLIELLPRTDIPTAEDLNKWKNMIALMLHRFRSPLTGISGFVELLEAESDAEKAEKRINSIQKGMNHLNNMMDELEVLYNISDDPNTIELDPVYIEKIVQEVSLWFKQEQRKRLNVHQTDRLTEILSNSGSLKALLKLLLLNSLEHSQDTAIDVQISESEGAFITIRNSGGPIPDEIEKHIFEPFVTTKAENFGIGLTKAVLFTRQLGGAIFMEQEQSNVYFILYFPVKKEKP